jgi:phage tail protein X
MAAAADSVSEGLQARPGAADSRRRFPAATQVTVGAALAGLALGLLALGPGLRPGFLLVYDMVLTRSSITTVSAEQVRGGSTP